MSEPEKDYFIRCYTCILYKYDVPGKDLTDLKGYRILSLLLSLLNVDYKLYYKLYFIMLMHKLVNAS